MNIRAVRNERIHNSAGVKVNIRVASDHFSLFQKCTGDTFCEVFYLYVYIYIKFSNIQTFLINCVSV